MGIRGIPANYGGFEIFAEELALRLTKRGYRVTIYGRSNIINYKEKDNNFIDTDQTRPNEHAFFIRLYIR